METKKDAETQDGLSPKNRRLERGSELLASLVKNEALTTNTKIAIARSQPEGQQPTWTQLAQALGVHDSNLRARFRKFMKNDE